MMTIALHGATFFAYHGFYPEEQKLGNQFVVDIEVSLERPVDLGSDEIGNTVNYEQLYEITAEQMKITRKLIETVAQGILSDIKSTYHDLNRIIVTIKKLNPPLGQKVAYSSVTLNYNKV